MADTYEVLGQRETTAQGPDGRFVDVVEVTYRSKGSGVVGHVDVPKSQYTVDRVHQLVDAATQAHDAVAKL